MSTKQTGENEEYPDDEPELTDADMPPDVEWSQDEEKPPGLKDYELPEPHVAEGVTHNDTDEDEAS